MKLYCIACEVLARPVYLCAARSPHVIDIELVTKRQHTHPAKLRALLQERIDAAVGYDAVVMGYGLCGQATDGLQARQVPVVIPRAHDCITLFLGSRERYQAQFDREPGTFWYSLDYLERDDGSGGPLSLGSGMEFDLASVYDEYVQKYGRDNADYLMGVMGAWRQHYQRAAFIDLGVGDVSRVQARAQTDAEQRGWRFESLVGDLVLLRRLLEGDWDDNFLLIQPGETAVMSYDERILECRLNGRSQELS